MNFSILEELHKKWCGVLPIGRDAEHGGIKYHIMGMSLSESDEAKLYVIEPYDEEKCSGRKRKGVLNNRRILKEQRECYPMYFHCSEIRIGDERFSICGGEGRPLKYSQENPVEEIQLFFDMMSAGWTVPEWLKESEWDGQQLVILDIDNMQQLPMILPETPVTIRHRPDYIRHILEKTVTLTVGKDRCFSFKDNYGDEVRCYINNVTLIDVWETVEKQFDDVKYTNGVSPEDLSKAKDRCFHVLEESCPKGTCYVGIEYECTKDISLEFYSKEHLKSRPQKHTGGGASMGMRLKPDRKLGEHGLPLLGCVMDVPVSPDTAKIQCELFCFYEKVKEWEERV